MIEGKAKFIFGTGDIMMTPVLNKSGEEKTGMLVFENSERHEIGEYTGQNPDFKISGKEALMVFHRIESIDVVIERLQLLKSMWMGNEMDILTLNKFESPDDFNV